jgi:hypothetical protein
MKTTILFLLMVAAVRADSVETTDKLTVYGRIERMDQTELTLTASFPSPSGVATQELKIPRSLVVKIEFNATTFNPGGPPAIGARPPNGSRAAPAGQDFAVLVDGHRQPCDGATIDTQQRLHCGKQEFPRSAVIRVFLATK